MGVNIIKHILVFIYVYTFMLLAIVPFFSNVSLMLTLNIVLFFCIYYGDGVAGGLIPITEPFEWQKVLREVFSVSHLRSRVRGPCM